MELASADASLQMENQEAASVHEISKRHLNDGIMQTADIETGNPGAKVGIGDTSQHPFIS